MFPRWIPYGCGVAAALFLVFLFVGGTILSGERFGEVVDFVIGMSLGEMRPMYSKDITAEEKAEFEAAVKTMREGLRSGKVSVAKVQPFLKSMQDVTADKKVTEEEIEKLTRVATETAKSQQPRAKPR